MTSDEQAQQDADRDGMSPGGFNDLPETTHADVLGVLDRAIEKEPNDGEK